MGIRIIGVMSFDANLVKKRKKLIFANFRIADEYEELRARFEKAVQEIRAMKKELRESHVQNDCLEISLINVRQDLKCKQQSYESQASMMAARIQDLTNKLSSAEKQVIKRHMLYTLIAHSFTVFTQVFIFRSFLGAYAETKTI